MAKSSIYIETSIISFLAARLSNNLTTAAWQQITRQWWDERRTRFELYTSELVRIEAQGGDPAVAERRLEFLIGLSELSITAKVRSLAGALISKHALPEKAETDALHIAIAAVHDMDYLLTWNCRHINNPSTKPAVRETCKSEGYVYPEICTPFEIMEVQGYEG